MQHRGRLLISCPDRPGIVAAVSRFLFEGGANIIHSDQHSTDPTGGQFFLRTEFELPGLAGTRPDFESEFAIVAATYAMEWRLALAAVPKRLAVFVSREDHCLLELLWQRRAGDLHASIAAVISNHDELRPIVEPWGIAYHLIPIDGHNKVEAEVQQASLLGADVDLIVLARYMQILSPSFIANWRNRIINIHHSFLPAFVGAKPYIQAHQRGVKIIGATAHYVTSELDSGPIIEQDVQRVDHRHAPDDLRRIGRQIERTVLARAVIWHCEDRILVHGNKTVVFD
ncbi:MAG: formyltetrahydrofolate deformylase [Chloroflexota bacterium]|nr:formyltetrahydrofolate deformylase [Chloroflexota bacterium]